jgi:hypothetical protein
MDAVLDYYRLRVEAAQEILAKTEPRLRDRIDFERGYWHERAILQRLMEKAGIPICHGALDCLASPTTTCVTIQHPSCPAHIYSCYMCVSSSDRQERLSY